MNRLDAKDAKKRKETKRKERPPKQGYLLFCSLSLSVLGVLGVLAVHSVMASARRSTPPTPEKQAALEEGQALFRGLCSGCHGGNGRGGKGPDLTDDRWIHGSSDDDIARVIRNGVPRTTMKKLGDALKEEQIRKVILYVRSLARAPGESTWKPYQAGDPKAG